MKGILDRNRLIANAARYMHLKKHSYTCSTREKVILFIF